MTEAPDILPGGQGFPNGKRLVRWLGFSSILDAPDPTDPKGRSIRTMLAKQKFPPRLAAQIRASAAYSSRYSFSPGVTGREIKTLNERHNSLSRAYRWSKKEGYIAEMDALDAEKLLSHPVLGREFAYADIENARTQPVLPGKKTREYWQQEAARTFNPKTELARARRALGG